MFFHRFRNRVFNMNNIRHIKDWASRRIEAINYISKKKGWSCSDNNPYFDEWIAILNSKAKTKQEYKLERSKNAKKILVNTFNAIRDKLCV